LSGEPRPLAFGYPRQRAEQEKRIYLNRVALIGFIGSDAERKVVNATNIAVFSLATKMSWKNDFNKPRMRQVAEAVLALSTSPTSPAGFTASDLAQKVRKMNGQTEAEYGPRRAAYDIKKLRAKHMIQKIGTSRRYESVPECLRAIAALLVLREKVIRPLLAASQRPESTSKPNHPTPVDHHYEHLRDGMRELFTALGMVA
jgi:hypothetical protein